MTREQRAAQIWPILTLCATRRQSLTYDHLARLIGVLRPGLGQLLEPMQSYCILNSLPPLTVLVVSNVDGPHLALPGGCASRIPNSLGRIRPTCVASAQCGPRRVVARHGARPHRRGMCAACVARQPPGIRQTPGGRRLSAHDCPCWRVKPLLLSNGSPLAVGFPSNASPYQLARRRRP